MKKNKITLIGNAHIDPVWLWRWQEGFAEIKATFRSALDRMNEFPEYYFTCAGASYYQWVEENCPEMFEEIRARVRQGRWIIVNGWWLQPDCNLPSGESFARHGLYAQRYYQEKFGIIATVGYNVDSFGHNAMLPQILKKSGMDSYVFMRPMYVENDLDAGSLFWWEAPDGSRVLTYRIPVSYCCGRDEDKDGFIQLMRRCVAETQRKNSHDLMFFYGVGNHGGGPTARQLNALRELNGNLDGMPVVHGHPRQFFDDILAQSLPLPTHRDDLQHHASGCYSAVSHIKKDNRKAENRLFEAEAYSVMASVLAKLPYPNAPIRQAWDNVMFNQFHDILGGCSIREACDDAREFLGESLAIAARASNAALQRISWAVNTMGGKPFSVNKDNDWAVWEVEDRGVPVVAFNSLSYPVKAQLQINMKAASVTDEKGNPIPSQLVRASQSNGPDNMVNTLFTAELPPFGYRVYRSYHAKPPAPETPDGTGLAITAHSIANKHIALTFDAHTGYIQSMKSLADNVELLAAPGAAPIVIDDSGNDTWAHGKFVFDQEIGRFSDARFMILEQGPVRAALRVTNRYGASTLTQDYCLTPDSGDITVKVTLDWRERNGILKLSFPCRFETPVATYEIPFGTIERPANGEEEPGLSWVDISGAVNGCPYGLSLANTAKYSYSVKGGDMRFIAARSSVYANHFGHRDGREPYMDLGIQEFTYLLAPHAQALRTSGIVQKAALLNRPPACILETYHQGPLEEAYSGLHVSGGAMVSALKASEDGNGYILRCYEPCGAASPAVRIRLPLLGREWTAAFAPFEIKTFYIPKDGTEIQERMITEWRLEDTAGGGAQ